MRSFFHLKDTRINEQVELKMAQGAMWPEVMVSLNPSFEPGSSIDQLVVDEVLHPLCAQIFRGEKSDQDQVGHLLSLHHHQDTAIRCARQNHNYTLTTGTGSGKSLAYIIPNVDYVLRTGSGNGIKAIVVYPMNALANSQIGELDKFLQLGFPSGSPVTYRRYTGQEGDLERDEIITNPPDILLTNYVMLELILTRPREQRLIQAASGLKFLVFDELHTYRGRQGADVAMLIRRLRHRVQANDLICVGTSATMGSGETIEDTKNEVAQVASSLFGDTVYTDHVIIKGISIFFMAEFNEELMRMKEISRESILHELASHFARSNHEALVVSFYRVTQYFPSVPLPIVD